MKTIGLLGGMSWESTATYYRLLNQETRARLGGFHSAELLLWSVDFAEIELLIARQEWQQASDVLSDAAQKLELAGAQCIAICAHALHKVADQIQSSISIPIIHITQSTGAAIKAAKARRPLILTTRYTDIDDIYINRLRNEYGFDPVLPDAGGRAVVHDIVYHELCRGHINDDSRAALFCLIEKGQRQGADSVMFGCTELGLLVAQDDISIPVIDTASEHVKALLSFALRPNEIKA